MTTAKPKAKAKRIARATGEGAKDGAGAKLDAPAEVEPSQGRKQADTAPEREPPWPPWHYEVGLDSW